MSNTDECRQYMPAQVKLDCFNQRCTLSCGLTVEHARKAMEDFIEFLGFINQQLCSKGIPSFESLLIPATFSGIVGEYIAMRVPEYSDSLVKNRYHNGHPDLIPKGKFDGDAVQHGSEGIEVKASRYARGWQGHNPESSWLMVFHVDSHSSNSIASGIPFSPFRCKGVYAARLDQSDWAFAGRSETSRRTIYCQRDSERSPENAGQLDVPGFTAAEAIAGFLSRRAQTKPG
ncbi:hypothetical protein [Chloroflexus sp.]|uniref:hypothetical protein n=1 Tax=Chloroflexus sp. TaxID=1904827 RepID=UPI00261B583E|nr:hypothetical protein [uncultured Chloroflexus sp.]